MGGDAQPQFQLQVLLNHLKFGMDIQSAIESPRFTFIPNRFAVPPRAVTGGSIR